MAPINNRARFLRNQSNLVNNRNDILNASDDELMRLFEKFLVWLRHPDEERYSWSERGNPVTQPVSDRRNYQQGERTKRHICIFLLSLNFLQRLTNAITNSVKRQLMARWTSLTWFSFFCRCWYPVWQWRWWPLKRFWVKNVTWLLETYSWLTRTGDRPVVINPCMDKPSMFWKHVRKTRILET